MKRPQFSFIILSGPKPSAQGDYMSAKELKRARLYFQKFVKLHHIEVKGPVTGMDGAADIRNNTIYVPTIKDIGQFYLCLHEVGHVLQTHGLAYIMDSAFAAQAAVINEYNAELFAIKHARLFGLDTAFYERHAKRYVFKFVKKVHQERTKWAKLHEGVRGIATNWLGITEADWLARELVLLR